MSKSSGEFMTLSLLIDKGYDPLDWRYFCLTGHYRSQLRFSYESLDSARSARLSLVKKVSEMLGSGKAADTLSEKGAGYENEFFSYMTNDLRAPQALASLWSMLKDSSLKDNEKVSAAFQFYQRNNGVKIFRHHVACRTDYVEEFRQTPGGIPHGRIQHRRQPYFKNNSRNDRKSPRQSARSRYSYAQIFL